MVQGLDLLQGFLKTEGEWPCITLRYSLLNKLYPAVCLGLLAGPVLATDYVVHVHGLVCSFCAKGVSKKVSKLPFVDRTKFNKGVKVEIEDQKVTIAVMPNHVLDIDRLFQAVKSGGYEPIDVWVVGENGDLNKLQP